MSKNTLESNEVELKVRKNGEAINTPIADVKAKVEELLETL